MQELTIDIQRLMKLVLVMAAVLAGTWLITMVIAPKDLSAAVQECVNCHVPEDRQCITCHDPEVGTSWVLDAFFGQLEYDSKPICAFVPSGEICATVSYNTCSTVKLAWSTFIGGDIKACEGRAETWRWT